MNYIKEAEEELKRYSDLNKSLEVLGDDIKTINFDLNTIKTTSLDSTPGGGNINGDDAIANMLFKKQVKERAYKSTYSKIKTIEKALNHIEKDGERDTDDKQLLLYYYVDKLGDDRTAEKLNISRSSFYRRKYIAITRFARQFFGVEVKWDFIDTEICQNMGYTISVKMWG